MVPGTAAVWWRGDLPSRTKTKTTHQKYSQTEKFTFVSNSPSAELRAPNFNQSPRPERYSQAPGRTTTRFYPRVQQSLPCPFLPQSSHLWGLSSVSPTTPYVTHRSWIWWPDLILTCPEISAYHRSTPIRIRSLHPSTCPRHQRDQLVKPIGKLIYSVACGLD